MKKEKVFVTIQLSGGNDYLNCIVPWENPLYRDFRKHIKITVEEIENVVSVGQKLNLRIVNVDAERKRLGLSIISSGNISEITDSEETPEEETPEEETPEETEIDESENSDSDASESSKESE